MKRDEFKAVSLPDPEREAIGLPVGAHGEFFVGGAGFAGQDQDASILDYNSPPPSQPGLWCQWTPSEDGNAIEWNGGEKFYAYCEWLEYLITNFLAPWGYILNGAVEFQGEDYGDYGRIVVEDSTVRREDNVAGAHVPVRDDSEDEDEDEDDN